MNANGPKAGIYTTEFAVTVLTAIVTIIVAVCGLTGDQARTLTGAIPVLAAVLVMGAQGLTYIKGRQELKQGTPPDEAIAGKVS